jgi:hypothetical protein
LGYSDANGDFNYTEAVNKAAEFGVIGEDTVASINAIKTFLRDDAVYATAKTLSAKMKGSDTQLVLDKANRGVTDSVCAEIVTGTNKAYNLYYSPQHIKNWTEVESYDMGDKTTGFGFIETLKLNAVDKKSIYVFETYAKLAGVILPAATVERNYYLEKWYENTKESGWQLYEDSDFISAHEGMFDNNDTADAETAEHDYTFFKNMVVKETSRGTEISYATDELITSLYSLVMGGGDIVLTDKNSKKDTILYFDKEGIQTGYYNMAELTLDDGTVCKLTSEIKDINKTTVVIDSNVIRLAQ